MNKITIFLLLSCMNEIRKLIKMKLLNFSFGRKLSKNDWLNLNTCLRKCFEKNKFYL